MAMILFLVQLPVPAVAEVVEVLTLEPGMAPMVGLVAAALKPVVLAEMVIHLQPLPHKAIAEEVDKGPQEAPRILVAEVVVLEVQVVLVVEHQIIMAGQVGQVELV